MLAVLLAAALAQIPAPTTAMAQRVSVESSVSAESVAAGGTVTLRAQVTPRKDMRIFAPGASKFTPVFLAVSRSRDFSSGIPKYPAPKSQDVPGTNKRALVYDGRIVLEQPITINKKVKSGDTLKISGLLTYQVCDDRNVYARSAVPVTWTVTVQ